MSSHIVPAPRANHSARLGRKMAMWPFGHPRMKRVSSSIGLFGPLKSGRLSLYGSTGTAGGNGLRTGKSPTRR